MTNLLATFLLAFTASAVGTAFALSLVNRDLWRRVGLLEKCLDALMERRIEELEQDARRDQKRA